jgi:hypothetical protein
MTTAAFAETCDPGTAHRFAQDNFGTVQLGHRARNQALLRLAEGLCRHPGGTLPNKLACPADYQSMCRLVNRPEVTHARVLAPHFQRTHQRMLATPGVVLVLHDTTELDYSGLDSITDLGPIGNGHGRGYLCHNSLAVALEQREVLGLAHQIVHARAPVPPHEGTAAKRARQSRESRLWSRATQALGPTPAGHTWIDVADRGADVFEFLATEQQGQRRCLVRACHNRAIPLGHADTEGARTLLFTHLRTLPALGRRTQTVYDGTAARAERSAHLAIAVAAVRLQPPHVRRGDYVQVPLLVWALRVWEPQPPAGTPGVEWFLLTTEPVLTAADAWERSAWYGCRPLIEEYHKAMKTGCHVEEMQFTTAAALQPMIGLLSVVAVLLFQLRQAARRPDAATRPATTVVDSIYEEVLRAWRYQQERGPLTVREFFLALGRLGGHMNRKCDGDPGWLVLHRGWMKLQCMVDGVEAARRRRKKRDET